MHTMKNRCARISPALLAMSSVSLAAGLSMRALETREMQAKRRGSSGCPVQRRKRTSNLSLPTVQFFLTPKSSLIHCGRPAVSRATSCGCTVDGRHSPKGTPAGSSAHGHRADGNRSVWRAHRISARQDCHGPGKHPIVIGHAEARAAPLFWYVDRGVDAAPGHSRRSTHDRNRCQRAQQRISALVPYSATKSI